MSTIHSSWAADGCSPLAAIRGIARFIAATSDCATSTQTHIAAVTDRRREDLPGGVRRESDGGDGDRVEVMGGTLGSPWINLNCKVCTP
ncbi:hypothetical protein HEK616_21010 [Streptomyces nigrescens]|uniref:Uncharacterized protein n=1 Tax=Streptomyces nigrescens TaxID=1920 RepID=A0ABM7ZQI7_STRNI|nr:hypothetical protein HEK616_21010 [Streptomyces nigrescens]